MLGMVVVKEDGSGRYLSVNGDLGEISSTDCKPGLFLLSNIEEIGGSIFVDKSLILSPDTILRDSRTKKDGRFTLILHSDSPLPVFGVLLGEKSRCKVCDTWFADSVKSLESDACEAQFYLDGNGELFCVIDKLRYIKIYWAMGNAIYYMVISEYLLPYIRNTLQGCERWSPEV